MLVSIGILTVLLGLLLPSLSGAVSRGRLTRDLMLVRQHAASIEMYCDNHKGVYPLITRSPILATQQWYVPLIDTGLYDSVEQVDARANEPGRIVSYVLSRCMVYDWRLMRPRKTVPIDDAVASAVHTSEVSFPSSKGLVYRANNGIPFPHDGGEGFCCAGLWEAPIAMADGSALSGVYTQFRGGSPLQLENGIGIPIATTWFGVRGMDR